MACISRVSPNSRRTLLIECWLQLRALKCSPAYRLPVQLKWIDFLVGKPNAALKELVDEEVTILDKVTTTTSVHSGSTHLQNTFNLACSHRGHTSLQVQLNHSGRATAECYADASHHVLEAYSRYSQLF